MLGDLQSHIVRVLLSADGAFTLVEAVAQSRNLFLRNQDFTAGRTMLTFRQTSCGTGGFHSCINHFGMTQSIHIAVNVAVTADITGMGRVTLLRTNGISYYGFIGVILYGNRLCFIVIAVDAVPTLLSGFRTAGFLRDFPLAIAVADCGYCYGFSAQFCCTDGAAYHIVITTICLTACSHFVFHNRFCFGMAQCIHIAVNIAVTADITGMGRVTLLRTNGISYYGFIGVILYGNRLCFIVIAVDAVPTLLSGFRTAGFLRDFPLAIAVADCGYCYGFSAQFCCTDGAAYHIVITTICLTACSHFVFHNRFCFGMAQCIHIAVNIAVTADITGMGRVTLLRTNGISYYGFIGVNRAFTYPSYRSAIVLHHISCPGFVIISIVCCCCYRTKHIIIAKCRCFAGKGNLCK